MQDVNPKIALEYLRRNRYDITSKACSMPLASCFIAAAGTRFHLFGGFSVHSFRSSSPPLQLPPVRLAQETFLRMPASRLPDLFPKALLYEDCALSGRSGVPTQATAPQKTVA